MGRPRLIRSPQLLAVAACVALVACVPVKPSSKSPKDAAEYNMQLGVSYIRQGDYASAQSKLEKAIQQDAGLASAHSALALVYDRLGDLAGAEREYRRAVGLAPDDPDILNSVAAFLCGQKPKQKEAMDYFQRALAIPLARTYYNRAMLYANAGLCAKRSDLPKAEEYLRSALAADPNYPEVLLQLADVAFLRGNYLQARAFIERYIAADPKSPAALWLAYRTEKALGQDDNAGRYGDRLKREFPEAVETGLLLEQLRNAGQR